MAYPPHFQFYFESNGENGDSPGPVYQLWVSPNKANVELVLEGRYVPLGKPESAELFKRITGQELSAFEDRSRA